MKIKRMIQKIIKNLFFIIIMFFVILLLKSANWFLRNFGGVEFSTVVYQIFSPMKGTEAGILGKYISECLYSSIYLSFIFLFLYNLYGVLMKKLLFEFKVTIWKNEFCFRTDNSLSVFSKSIIWGIIIILFGAYVGNMVIVMGIPKYIKDITSASELYEMEYVEPDEVSVRFPQRKRNLLLIYMESMETTYASTEVGGGKPINYIPELTELAEENLYFSNDDDLGGAGAYSGTTFTMGALLASSTGVPYKLPIGGNDAGEYEAFLPGLIGLGEILAGAGYQNYFMCGSDAIFGGRSEFYEQHGDYCILDYNRAKEEGVIPEDYQVFWGMEDQKLYEWAKQELTQISGNAQPFNFTMLTVDTHHTDGYLCELCDDEYPKQYENVIACASRQVYQFVNWAREQDWYENTTIIIMGDHRSMKANFWDDIGDYDRRIYNCFINLPKDLSANRTMNREFSTMDMFPTILAAIGVDIEGDRLGLGTNLFSNEQTLPEKMGKDMFDSELALYSNYYYQNFIVADTQK